MTKPGAIMSQVVATEIEDFGTMPNKVVERWKIK